MRSERPIFQSEVHPSTAVTLHLRLMAQRQETQEYRTFREHYDRLYHAIQDPLSLATRLFAKNIITSAVKEEMGATSRTRLDKNDALLSAVETQIRTDPSTLHVFLSILNEDSAMQSLVENVQGKKCCVHDYSHRYYMYTYNPNPRGGYIIYATA